MLYTRLIDRMITKKYYIHFINNPIRAHPLKTRHMKISAITISPLHQKTDLIFTAEQQRA